ncbi:DUF1611 domain-containing protein [Methanopyrus sp.]
MLLIGATPPGGKLIQEWKEGIEVVRTGLDVVSGLHVGGP